MKSKSKSIAIILILGIVTLFIFPVMAKKQQANTPRYTVTLTIQEWQAVINSIEKPDDFSNNQKKQISELLQKNLVLVDTSKAKK